MIASGSSGPRSGSSAAVGRSGASRARRILLLVATALAAACNPGGDGGADNRTNRVSTTVDTVDGVIRTHNAGTPPEWQLVRVASIGPESMSETGSPDEFGNVYDVALGPDGAVFVADAANREVRVFGVDGAHRRTFGREGEGPGEFGRLYSVAWLGGRLLALDSQQGRISEFSIEGEFLGQRRIRGGLSGGPGWVRLYRVGAEEAYHVTLAEASVPGRWWEFIGIDGRAETGDTLLQIAGPGAASIVCEHGERISFFEIPFGTKLVQRPGPGGLMYSALTDDDYRIAVTNADDDTVRIVERALPGEPVFDDEWAERNSRYRALRDTFPLMRCDPTSPPRPDVKPFIEEIDIAYDGTLWVEVVRETGNRWEVFDAQGRLLAHMPAPTDRRYVLPPAIGTDHVLTVRRGDFDLDYVDVWRIERGN